MSNKLKNEILTPANIVTLVRIILIPVFVVVLLSPWPQWVPGHVHVEIFQPWIAAVVFALLAATDGVDGYLARSRNQVTDFGKFIDPLADKILVCAALLALIELGSIPSWIVLIIIAREFIVSGLRMLAASNGVVIAAAWPGKVKTVLQILAIICFIVKNSFLIEIQGGWFTTCFYYFSWTLMITAVVMTVISMFDYFWKTKEIFISGKC